MPAVKHDSKDRSGQWWIEHDRVFQIPGVDPLENAQDEFVFEELGLVRLAVGDMGTRLTWDIDNAPKSSLLTALNRLPELTLPIQLAAYKNAWAFETYHTVAAAEARIVQLMAVAGDPVCATSAVTRHDFGDHKRMAPLLRRAASCESDVSAYQCLWRYHETNQDFLAHTIGPRSSIACIMGQDWVASAIGTNAAPTDNTEAFNTDAVDDQYQRVFESGEPAFDEVAAITTPPDGPSLYVTWHRLLEPWIVDGRPIGCRVTTEHVSQALPNLIVPTPPASPRG